ncbi:MAG: type II toxin-antitoxin system VapC family toxin [Sterolibacteriaceae bacterium]|jgi:predicted nucleic acid-binding protein|nr:type II toxin-antitoxin system VapC family toxin [Sterolibacteriaceae bacterium]MBK9086165.1 type II toxin-antitoxin system VapC family toxin [Sterolibacteriaceae bacterium]
MKCVVDTNIAIKWVIPEPDSATALDLLAHRIHAPELLLPECLNVLWRKRMKKELDAKESGVALTALAAARIEWIPIKPLMSHVLELAVRLDHPAYDCTYLAAAMHIGVPMVTADGRFVRRCRRSDAKDLAPFVRLLGEPLDISPH